MERPSLNEARGLVTQFIINASYKWPNEKYSFIGMPQSEPWVSSCPADCSIQPFSTAIVLEHLGSTISKVFGAVDGWIHFTWGVGGWPYPMVNPRVEWTIGTTWECTVNSSSFKIGNIISCNSFRLEEGQVRRESVEEAWRAALMHEFVRDLPHGYETILRGGVGVGLSGGQKQRLSMARAKLRNPTVLILRKFFFFFKILHST